MCRRRLSSEGRAGLVVRTEKPARAREHNGRGSAATAATISTWNILIAMRCDVVWVLVTLIDLSGRLQLERRVTATKDQAGANECQVPFSKTRPLPPDGL